MRSSELRQELMKGCRENAIRDFPIEYRLEKQIDKAYYDILKMVSPINPQNDSQKANVALAIRNFRLIHVAYDELEKGYYEVSMNLLRNVYENSLQMRYFAKFEDEARLWLEGKKKIEQKTIRKKLNIKADLYSVLSDNFAHSLRSISVLPIVLGREGERLNLLQFPMYFEDYCQLCLFCCISFAWNTVQAMQSTFKKDQISDKALVRYVVSLEKVILAYIRETRIAISEKVQK